MTDKKHDAAWYETMYNNRARVPEYAEHFRRWAADSADALRTLHREVDVRYGGGPSEHLDIFPAGDHDAPVLLFIHGGYWRSLDKREHSFIAPAFTKEGVCFVNVNYALAPAVTIPQIVMQVVHAVAWTWRHIARYGGDPDRIVVVGHSAGGHLAAMMAACVWHAYGRDLPADVVKGALSISGLHDLDPIMRTASLQESLRLTAADARKASPALLPPPSQGKLYSVCGDEESEEYHRQNRAIQQAWGKQRVPVCETIPKANHFSVVETLAQPGSRLNTLALELLKG